MNARPNNDAGISSVGLLSSADVELGASSGTYWKKNRLLRKIARAVT